MDTNGVSRRIYEALIAGLAVGKATRCLELFCEIARDQKVCRFAVQAYSRRFSPVRELLSGEHLLACTDVCNFFRWHEVR